MHFIFRTDASDTIGTGHLMRCLALAKALQAGGANSIFVCRGAGLEGLAWKIKEEGHHLLTMPEADMSPTEDHPSQYSHWLPGGWQQDVEACRHALRGHSQAEWLVVDHYALDHRWERAMRFAAQRILVIDDLANRSHNCDILLDQSLLETMASRYEGLVPDHCICLLGPRYALLRKEFERVDVNSGISRSIAYSRVLIMFGGADACNLTLRTVQALVRLNWPGKVDIVVGPLYRHVPLLKIAIIGLKDGVLHESAKNIALLMRASDVAVGSPGVASWERCACGLPALTISQAENQEPIAKALAEAGAHWYLGRAEEVTDQMLDATLITWLSNKWGLQALGCNARAVCDGRGSQRVVRYLNPLVLTIRKVEYGDCDLLFSWRNDERVRNQSIDKSPLDRNTHEAWVAMAVNSKTVALLLACQEDTPVACVRFDLSGERVRISIYTDPNLQARGLGSAAMKAAVAWLRVEYPDASLIEAEVLMGNATSHSMFINAGYRPTVTQYEFALNEHE